MVAYIDCMFGFTSLVLQRDTLAFVCFRLSKQFLSGRKNQALFRHIILRLLTTPFSLNQEEKKKRTMRSMPVKKCVI